MKNMESILGSLQHARETPIESETAKPEPKPAAVKPTAAKKQAQPKPLTLSVQPKTVGKSSNPDFEPVKVLLRKTTRKKAERQWNDTTDQDFSDLVEHLLLRYLGEES